MSVYRINAYNSFENVIKRKAFSAPSAQHPLFKELSELSNWGEVENIRHGNVILICRGIRFIWAIGYARGDCRITDVDAFKPVMKYEENGFRFVNMELYREFQSPVDGKKIFTDLLSNNPFDETFFCVRLNPLIDKKEEFTRAMNHLLEL
jgi:hypothetical protein